MGEKVVVIGLDGATWSVINQGIKAGKLPTFRKLKEEGVWGELESTIPPTSCPAWPCLYTGKKPEKLGLYFFTRPRRDSLQTEIAHLNWRKWYPIWEILRKDGKSSCIVNVFSDKIPNNDPESVFILGPWMRMFRKGAHPPQIEDWLRKLNYSFYDPNFSPRRKDDYIREIFEQVKREFYVVKKLLQKDKWDFYMYTLWATDALQHFFWKYADKTHPLFVPSKYENVILNCYQLIDRFLSEILLMVEENGASLFILSDHGHGPLYKGVDLNAWLEKEGFLKLKCGKKRKVTQTRIRKILFKLRLEQILFTLKKFRCISNIIDDIANKIPVAERSIGDINFEETKAYCITYGGIHINIKGREPHGIVTPEEYEKIRKEIMQRLYELRDPETEVQVVEKAFRKEEIYSNINFDSRSFPDIIIKFKDESKYITTESMAIRETVFYPSNWSGAHTSRGIFLAYGPGIKKGCNIKGAKIYDITPTILFMLGVPVPRDIDGRVLAEIFAPSSELAKKEVIYQQRGEKDVIREKIKYLRSLGRI